MAAVAKTHGFSLPELLLVLLILGNIAAFSIPKVLQSQTSSQRTAVLKESYATMSQLAQMAQLEGADDGQMLDIALEHLNYVKYCPDSTADGCYTSTFTCGAAGAAEDGFVLANGAVIFGFNNDTTPDGTESLCIDWNGTAGPNLTGVGNDILEVRLNLWDSLGSSNRLGTVTTYGTSQAAFEELFD